MLPIGVSVCQFWCLCVREQQGYREKTDGLNSPSGFVLTFSPDVLVLFIYLFILYHMYVWVRCDVKPLQYLYLLDFFFLIFFFNLYMDVGGAYMHGWLH